MEWALVILFSLATILLVYSYYKNIQMKKIEQREIDTIYMSLMDEIKNLQTQLRNIELEKEIIAQHTGLSIEELQLLRDSLDLYKRGYTLEGIANRMNLELEQMEQLLSPYTNKTEGRTLSNES